MIHDVCVIVQVYKCCPVSVFIYGTMSETSVCSSPGDVQFSDAKQSIIGSSHVEMEKHDIIFFRQYQSSP